jgi:hypothetical protein
MIWTMSDIIGRIRAEVIGRIPPQEYIEARKATLDGMKIRAERTLAVMGLGSLSIEPKLESALTDAVFFAAREEAILGFAAQALQASSIKMDHGGGANTTKTLTISSVNRESAP